MTRLRPAEEEPWFTGFDQMESLEFNLNNITESKEQI